MPQIPVYRQNVSASIGTNMPRMSTGPALAQSEALGTLARTVSQAAPEIADSFERIQVSENAWKMADSTAKSLGELEQFRGELSADDDYDSHASKFLERAKDIEERVGQQLPTSIMRVWKQDFRRITQQNAMQVGVESQKLKAAKVRSSLGNTLLSLSELTGTDPHTDEAVRAQAHLAIDSNAQAGNLSFDERNTLINKFDQDSVEASIRRDMLNDPDVAEQRLAAGEYRGLPGEVQAIWATRIAQAAESRQRRGLADEDRQYRLSERDKKEAADATAKHGDSLLASGKLTADWIEANRDTLDPADFRHFYDQLKGGGGEAPRDANTYMDLRDKAGRGEDVRDSAREAMRNGQIRVSDYNTIVGEVENQRPGWYKLGSQYISTMAGVSDLNPDPAAAQTKATMLDQWSQWTSEHPQATDRDARSAYQDIVSHNMLVKMSGLPLPRLLVGSRFEPDLAATEAATVKAYQDQQIDRQEFERQAQLLSQWRLAIGSQTKAPK